MAPLLVKTLTLSLASSVFLLLMAGILSAVSGSLDTGNERITLPAPDRDGSVPLETTLQKRRSVRSFQDAPLALQAVSQLLWAAQGITDRRGFRTAPSAGALYPLEIYVAVEKVSGLTAGIYLYEPLKHSLILIAAGDYLAKLSRVALWQDVITQAPAVFVVAGMAKRTTSKYGERGLRYMYMESGHAAQNICLQAVAIGLDSVTIGAFTDNEVARVLQMEKGLSPLYIIPVGKAKH